MKCVSKSNINQPKSTKLKGIINSWKRVVNFMLIAGVMAFMPSKAFAADIDCNIGSAIGSLGGFPNSLIGNCIYDGSSNLGLINSGSSNFSGVQSSASPAPASPNDLGSSGSNAIIDFGTTEPSFGDCVAATYNGATSVPAVDGNWYCARYTASNDTGYVYGQFIDQATGFAPASQPATPEAVDALSNSMLALLTLLLLYVSRKYSPNFSRRN